MSTVPEKIIKSVRNLPTLPTIYSTLADAMLNPRTTNEDIAKLISSDQASSIKVLKVVNSPFFGLSGRIDSISRAILHLGFNEIRNIVLSLTVINLFSKKKLINNFRPADFWKHSIGVGVSARLIGNSMGLSNVENFFISGILHDIGKLLFFEYESEEYENVFNIVEQKGCSISEAEKEVFGIDHSYIGKLLAEKWKLPISIQNAIAYHHSGMIGTKHDSLVAAVHIGNIAARLLKLGYPGDDLVPEPNPLVWEQLKLPDKTFSSTLDILIQNYYSTTEILLST